MMFLTTLEKVCKLHESNGKLDSFKPFFEHSSLMLNAKFYVNL